MRIFKEDPAMLVPGDLAFLSGAWDQVRLVFRRRPDATFVRVESDPFALIRVPAGETVKVAR